MTEMRKIALQIEITANMENEAFCEALTACENTEQLHSCLLSNGIDITIEEVAEFQALGKADLQNVSTAELSADVLDYVSGGGWLRQTGRFLASAAGGAVLGFACGVCPALTPAIGPYVVVTSLWVAQG